MHTLKAFQEFRQMTVSLLDLTESIFGTAWWALQLRKTNFRCIQTTKLYFAKIINFFPFL